MIRNILFDMGAVLLKWDPALFIRRLGVEDEQDRKILMNGLYLTTDWIENDRGTITDEIVIERAKKRIPERLHPYIEPLASHWDDPKDQNDEVYKIVEELKNNGYEVYSLTNACLRHHEYFPTYPVSKLFGDRVFRSCDWKLMKPEREFYEKALEVFQLDPAECVFIDDSPANAEGALRCGIDAIVFHQDAEELRSALRERGVNISL